MITWTAAGIPSVRLPLSAKTHFPWAIERVAAGELVAFSSLTDVPSEIDRETLHAIGTKSAIYVPLSVDGRVTGAVGFTTVRAERSWPPEVVHRLKVFASVFEQGLARQQRDEAMLSASREVQRLKDRLHAENVYLRLEERERLGLASIVGQSAAIRQYWSKSGRSRAPTPRCSCSGKRELERNSSPRKSTNSEAARGGRWCGSTAERFRRRSSKASCSGGRKARSRGAIAPGR